MELKIGYKIEKATPINGDYGAKPIHEIFYFRQGIQAAVEKQKLVWGPGLLRFIRIVDVTQKDQQARYIEDPGSKHHVTHTDLFMVRYGNPGLVAFGYNGVIANNLFRLIPKIPIIPSFYYHVLAYKYRDILQLSSSTTMPAVNFTSLNKLFLPFVADLVEQTAIANVLNDVDSLIWCLKKLITKKLMIKEGAMQELLEPKPNWKKKTLGACAVLKARIGWQGLTTKEYKSVGDYNLITGTEFENGYIDFKACYFVDYNRYKQDKHIQLKPGDILVTKDGTIGKVAFVKDLPRPATLNSGVFVIRPVDKSFSPLYMYYVFRSKHFTQFLSQLTAGSTISHLYQKDFVHFEFRLPPDYDQQEQIAEVLSDLDTEIFALEEKLQKNKLIKEGMVQKLLSGKIRLTKKEVHAMPA
jgi:restriction endonuclease S subunit